MQTIFKIMSGFDILKFVIETCQSKSSQQIYHLKFFRMRKSLIITMFGDKWSSVCPIHQFWGVADKITLNTDSVLNHRVQR